MTLSRPNAGVLVVHTFPTAVGNIMGSSEKSLAAKLGDEFKVRAISALSELDGPIPENGVILNGSPYSILEDHPWLEQYKLFIRSMVAQGKAVLGVCFGHQILAETFGGFVEKADKALFGAQEVSLTDAGRNHPLFQGIPRNVTLPSSHFDHVTRIPPTGATLATARTSAHYAFDIPTEGNGCAWGVQFHPEMNGERLASVIEVKQDGIPDWEARRRIAKETNFETYGATIISNYGKAVIRSKK